MKSSLWIAGSLAASLLVSACQDVAVETNISPKNFEEYFKPASVDVYTKDTILEQRYHSLGMVAGLACQEKPEDFIARESEARLDALVQAADMGANGIVYGKCIRLERTQACYVSVTCYGEAFVVDNGKTNENSQNLAYNKAKAKASGATPIAAAPVVLQAPTTRSQVTKAKAVAPATKAAPVARETSFIDKNGKAQEAAPAAVIAPAAPKVGTASAVAPAVKSNTYMLEAEDKLETQVQEEQPRSKYRRNRIYKIQLDQLCIAGFKSRLN